VIFGNLRILNQAKFHTVFQHVLADLTDTLPVISFVICFENPGILKKKWKTIAEQLGLVMAGCTCNKTRGYILLWIL